VHVNLRGSPCIPGVFFLLFGHKEKIARESTKLGHFNISKCQKCSGRGAAFSPNSFPYGEGTSSSLTSSIGAFGLSTWLAPSALDLPLAQMQLLESLLTAAAAAVLVHWGDWRLLMRLSWQRREATDRCASLRQCLPACHSTCVTCITGLAGRSINSALVSRPIWLQYTPINTSLYLVLLSGPESDTLLI